MTPTPESFSKLHLYTVLHALPHGVTLANVEGEIVFSNHAADEILGRTAATGAPPDDWSTHYGVFVPDSEEPFPTEEYPLVRALKGEIVRDVDMLIRNSTHPDGLLISASSQRLFDTDGTPIGAVVIFRDVTKLRSALTELAATNEQLIKEQRLRDEMASYVVHDLKNPLTTIITVANLIHQDDEVTDQTKRDAEDIGIAAERMRLLLLDLLDVQMAQDGALELERTRLSASEFLDEVRPAAEGRVRGGDTRVVIDDPPDLQFDADRSLLIRLVLNLVDNCVKYGPPDGTIWIGAARGDGEAVLTARDEGPGVPEHLRDRIFERYARAEREGFRSEDSKGLGLRFCRVVAEAHGGRIWVENAEPRGAKFCVAIPA